MHTQHSHIKTLTSHKVHMTAPISLIVDNCFHALRGGGIRMRLKLLSPIARQSSNLEEGIVDMNNVCAQTVFATPQCLVTKDAWQS